MVTYPTGGSVAYTYDSLYFHPNLPISSVVASKKASDGGNWTYSYKPATDQLPADLNLWTSFPENKVDITTVVGPDATRKYAHIGYMSAPSGGVFQIGQLVWDSVGDVQRTGYSSNLQLISMQPNQRPGDTLTFDSHTYAPIPWGHSINRYGQLYSEEFSSVDAYGNPTAITESGTDKREATFSYHVDTSRWILRAKKDESRVYKGGTANFTLSDGPIVVTRVLDGAANLVSETRDGVKTSYTYHPTGDLFTRTNARDGVTTYTNYFRGVARSEVQPEDVTIARTVSDAGNVLSVTDGELAATTYEYDGLNRVTYIGHPVGNPVNVVWASNKRTVTRGGFKEDTAYDDFGREIELSLSDATTGGLIRTTSKYDAIGNRTFSSYPNGVSGTDYWYDALGQVLQEAHGYDKVMSMVTQPDGF